MLARTRATHFFIKETHVFLIKKCIARAAGNVFFLKKRIFQMKIVFLLEMLGRIAGDAFFY